ncbi:hypothetical protein BurJ1DRAFT_1588 [Burkholderiales bacterium JOSHI_001]|nr:hypothetical protein BurJ1DRAFT_1588 [Burkholderiales bacterium JOSHI_001]
MKHPLSLASGLVLSALTLALAACGGGDSAPAAGSNAGNNAGNNQAGNSGGGTSADGPTVDAALLAKLCPSFNAGARTYSNCKSSSDASVNALLIDINIWLAANSPTKAVSASPAPDASYGVVAGNACGFSFEPGLGLWMMTLKNAAGPVLGWTGTAMDTVQVNAAGAIIYMSVSKDATGAGFTNASGEMEINFPGVTQGTATEVVYGLDAKLLSCKMK